LKGQKREQIRGKPQKGGRRKGIKSEKEKQYKTTKDKQEILKSLSNIFQKKSRRTK